MRYDQFIAQYIRPYEHCQFFFDPSAGFIVWRVGTGDNVELLHIRTLVKGQGHGRDLVYHMLDELTHRPPYHSVFGFCLAGNEQATQFYRALGFIITPLGQSVYGGDGTVIFHQEYGRLCRERELYESCLHSRS